MSHPHHMYTVARNCRHCTFFYSHRWCIDARWSIRWHPLISIPRGNSFCFYLLYVYCICCVFTIFLCISSRSPYELLTSSPITLVSALTYCILFEYYDWSVFTRFSLFFSKAFLSPSFIHHICTFYMYKAFVVYSTIYLFVLQVIWRGLLSVGSFVGSLEQVQVLPCL